MGAWIEIRLLLFVLIPRISRSHMGVWILNIPGVIPVYFLNARIKTLLSVSPKPNKTGLPVLKPAIPFYLEML